MSLTTAPYSGYSFTDEPHVIDQAAGSALTVGEETDFGNTSRDGNSFDYDLRPRIGQRGQVRMKPLTSARGIHLQLPERSANTHHRPQSITTVGQNNRRITSDLLRDTAPERHGILHSEALFTDNELPVGVRIEVIEPR